MGQMHAENNALQQEQRREISQASMKQ
jgi:hypothetical protein